MANVTTDTTANKLKVLSVFDFDGTLTYYNSFILFLYFAFGRKYFIKCLTRIMLLTLRHIHYMLTHDKLKEILIKVFLTNISEYWLNQQAERFCNKYWNKLIRPIGALTILEEINSGAEVVICSASPTIILQPFANKLGTELIGTRLEIKFNKLTGHIIGYNCRCAQKLIELKNIYGDLSSYYLRVWGDTRGDYELLAAAQDPHWRYFHKIEMFHSLFIL